MDVGTIVSIILGLLYLFYTSVNKKKEEEKRRSGTTTEETGQKKPSLQERLDQAIQEMQQRVEGAEAAPEQPQRKSTAAANTSESGVQPTLLSTPQFEESFAQTMTAEEFDPTWAGVKEANLANRMDNATTALESSPDSRKREKGRMSDFKQAHGLHYVDGVSDPVEMSTRGEFHEAHGIHHGDMTGHSHTIGDVSYEASEAIRMLGDIDDVRKGIILAEILGKPKAAAFMYRH